MYGLQKGSQLTEAFVKTADKNIVHRWRVVQDEIYIDKCQANIDALQAEIDSMPAFVKYPVGASAEAKAAIDYFNRERVRPTTDLEADKAYFEDLKAKAEAAEIGDHV